MSTQAAPTPVETRIDRLSPDSLVASFSQSHLVRWFLVAFAMHTVVIGAFSIGYVRDLIDPVGAARERPRSLPQQKQWWPLLPPQQPRRQPPQRLQSPGMERLHSQQRTPMENQRKNRPSKKPPVRLPSPMRFLLRRMIWV